MEYPRDHKISQYQLDYVKSKIKLFYDYYDEFILHIKLFPQYDQYHKNIDHVLKKVQEIDKEDISNYNSNNKKISCYLRKLDQCVFAFSMSFQKNIYQEKFFDISRNHNTKKEKNQSEYMINISNAKKIIKIPYETIINSRNNDINVPDVSLNDFLENIDDNDDDFDDFDDFIEDFNKVNLYNDKSDTDESFVMV